MHESGLIRKLIAVALREAEGHGGSLRAIHVRLGALAGGTSEHLQDHFDREIAAMNIAAVVLRVTEAPECPTGIEIVGIEVAEPAP